jgi:hypothetical protein
MMRRVCVADCVGVGGWFLVVRCWGGGLLLLCVCEWGLSVDMDTDEREMMDAADTPSLLLLMNESLSLSLSTYTRE